MIFQVPVLICLLSVTVCQATTTSKPECTCPHNQYCLEYQGAVACRLCDKSCDGCEGPSNGDCKQCNPGFKLNNTKCSPCPANLYGVNCTGTCHCLQGPANCDQTEGFCTNDQCDRGWTGLPTCQTPCEENKKFGADCELVCHCPKGDNCSAINGLCSGGSCEYGWFGSGCQIQLAILSDPPILYNVTCAEVVIEWRGWGTALDIGDSEAVIAQYELAYFIVGNSTEWLRAEPSIVPHVSDQEVYTVTLTNLVPDATYKFRVDVRQQNGDKIMADKAAGKESREVVIPCTVPTTTTTTTPVPGTTVRPPGPHLLDLSKFGILFLDNETVSVTWAVYSNASNYILNLTLTYYASGIGNCQKIESPEIYNEKILASGSFNISDLLPWRQYVVQVMATSIEHSITDYISKDFSTPEEAPSGIVPNIQVISTTKNGATIQWRNLPCEERGGVLLYYLIEIFALPNETPAGTYSTNATIPYYINQLLPYRRYGVSVRYINSVGYSQRSNLTEFQTEEDVPDAPAISEITTQSTSITVEIVPPPVTNGILTNYIVTIDTNSDFSAAISRTQSVSLGNSMTIRGLLAFRLYSVKVQAETSAGKGLYSSIYNAMTRADVPYVPEDITSIPESRNESCVEITWSPPSVSTGTITGYNVTYSERGTSVDESSTVRTSDNSSLICDLAAGRYYDIEVFASTSAGYSIAARYQTSTEQSDPPVPPRPVVLKTTTTSIGIALDPISRTTTAFTHSYIVFVDDMDAVDKDTRDLSAPERKKRATSASTTTCPGEIDLPGYIARNFSGNDFVTRTEFIVGDGGTYGIYNNTKLTKGHRYNIYYVITSYFEGICKYSFTRPENSPITAEIREITTEPIVTVTGDDRDNTVLIIIIVVLGVIIILVIFVVIFLCWWRQCRTEQKYIPQVNDEKYDLKVYRVDEYDPQKYWNTVYSLRESRYIIAGRKYLPNDHQFMNGSAGVETTGQPVTFADEFRNLPKDLLSSNAFASRQQNSLKNRFPHLLPYDHSRVILEPDAHTDSSYINASFISGYKHQRAYIAAQSPFDEETVLDFWRMIYQYEVRVVVMMAKIVEDNIVKCTQYWPTSGRASYGSFILDLVNLQQFAGYCIRTVKVRTKDDPHWHIVYIFDLTYWPDHGVPTDAIPLLEMRHKVNTYHNKDKSPVIVHCGTGVSRTGVFIAIDSLLQQYETDGRISVYSFVRKMRKNRLAMVRTVKQYTFIYEAIFEAMVAGKTMASFDLKDMYQQLSRRNTNTHHSYLRDQFKCLQEYTRKLYPYMCSNAILPANIDKNRFSEVVPADLYRPVLQTPGGLGRTDYINAVFLDSHYKPNHFIVTQTPLHTTVIDFWKLVYDHNVDTIVMMENYKNEDDTCAEYWPEDRMKQYEPFFVEITDVFQQDNITIRHLKLVSMNRPHESRMVRQFQFNAWSDTEFIPKSKSMLLDVMDLVKDWQTVSNNDTSPIIVHCKDGATHSGLFAAVWVLCETILDENEVDLFHTVKHMKIRRNQIVDTLDQYRFCYKALWDFMNMRMPGGTLTEQMSRTRSDRQYVSLSLTSYGSGQELVS